MALILVLINPRQSLAQENKQFDIYMNQWDQKRELASQYLIEAEKSFKEGDELSACSNQQKASEFGIEATQALIKAMKINGSNNGIENLQAGLDKWRELGKYCT